MVDSEDIPDNNSDFSDGSDSSSGSRGSSNNLVERNGFEKHALHLGLLLQKIFL